MSEVSSVPEAATAVEKLGAVDTVILFFSLLLFTDLALVSTYGSGLPEFLPFTGDSFVKNTKLSITWGQVSLFLLGVGVVFCFLAQLIVVVLDKMFSMFHLKRSTNPREKSLSILQIKRYALHHRDDFLLRLSRQEGSSQASEEKSKNARMKASTCLFLSVVLSIVHSLSYERPTLFSIIRVWARSSTTGLISALIIGLFLLFLLWVYVDDLREEDLAHSIQLGVDDFKKVSDFVAEERKHR
jgi:uncharacterized membrane protein